ncbi:MAG: hypothetical protein LBC84_03080, partial [Prevotellaceae bacterium]|nr:hypothetical protein [Prevotellaceae bacterium]
MHTNLIIMPILEKESNTFDSKLSELLKSDTGKYVLIKGDKVVGIYAAITDALGYGYKKYKDQSFFV